VREMRRGGGEDLARSSDGHRLSPTFGAAAVGTEGWQARTPRAANAPWDTWLAPGGIR
jgi:hypothetical protein